MIKKDFGQSGYLLSSDHNNKPLKYRLEIWSPSLAVNLFFSEKEAEQFISDCLEEFHNYDSDTDED